MNGYDLIEFIAENHLGDAEVFVEGTINALCPPNEEETEDSRKISVSAEYVEGNYRGNVIAISIGTSEIDLR